MKSNTIERTILNQLKDKRTGANHTTLKDISILLNARKNNDYTEVFKRNLYISHSGEYCRLLEVIEQVVV